MINVPKGLAPHEVDLYISAFKFCEKLIQEQNTDIGAAVTETTEKYSFIISDKELFAQFLFREITAYTEPSIGVVSPNVNSKTRISLKIFYSLYRLARNTLKSSAEVCQSRINRG